MENACSFCMNFALLHVHSNITTLTLNASPEQSLPAVRPRGGRLRRGRSLRSRAPVLASPPHRASPGGTLCRLACRESLRTIYNSKYFSLVPLIFVMMNGSYGLVVIKCSLRCKDKNDMVQIFSWSNCFES